MRLSRIYYLLLVVIGSLALASCDDDDKVVDEGLKVLSAETSFDANGGEHEISVNKDVVKAYAADDWLAVNAQGSKVTISTQANVSNESRHTTLVVKSSETDSTIVNVSQLGSIFVLEGLPSGIAASDAAVSYTYSMKHNLPVEVSSSADWIKVSVTDDSFKVDLKKNETGRFRSGSFTYSSGNIKNTINVSQSEFARDFEGMYYLAYTSNEGTQVAISAKFVKDAEGNYALDLPQLGLSVPVAFDESTFKLSIYAGHNLGVFQKYNTVCYSKCCRFTYRRKLANFALLDTNLETSFPLVVELVTNLRHQGVSCLAVTITDLVAGNTSCTTDVNLCASAN